MGFWTLESAFKSLFQVALLVSIQILSKFGTVYEQLWFTEVRVNLQLIQIHFWCMAEWSFCLTVLICSFPCSLPARFLQSSLDIRFSQTSWRGLFILGFLVLCCSGFWLSWKCFQYTNYFWFLDRYICSPYALVSVCRWHFFGPTHPWMPASYFSPILRWIWCPKLCCWSFLGPQFNNNGGIIHISKLEFPGDPWKFDVFQGIHCRFREKSGYA